MLTQYKNVEMQQNANIFSLFSEFLNKENFVNIIEIGTRYGAFTRLLKDIYPKSNIYTYNIRDERQIDLSDIQVRIKNIFDREYQHVHDEEILSIIYSKNKNLILCDGWNKIKEFNCLAKYIKSGDVLMAHDYAVSNEYFEEYIKGKIWNWCEITDADVSEVSEKYELVNYNQEEFQKAAWLCKIKK